MRISERENSSGAEEGRDINAHPKNKNLGGEKKKMNKITNKKTFALLLSVVFVISAMSAVMPAIATTPSYPLSPDDTEITSALDYLHSVQSDDGNISDFGTSAWVAMAIAATGENPHKWKTAPGNPSVVDYLRDNPQELQYEWNIVTAYERMILAIVAACEDPSAFGEGNETYVPDGDYLAQLKAQYDGTQFGDPLLLNDDFWGILALVAAGEDPNSEMIQSTADYIKGNQSIVDGGWSWCTPDHNYYSGSDVDDTAAVIMALIAAGESPSSACITNATNYLHVEQDATTGGFESWGVVNAASTSWAIDAIVSVGQDPTSENWTEVMNNPVDLLLTLQSVEGAPAGSFVYADPLPGGYLPMYEKMTADAIVALLGKPYPVKPTATDIVLEIEDELDALREDLITNELPNKVKIPLLFRVANAKTDNTWALFNIDIGKNKLAKRWLQKEDRVMTRFIRAVKRFENHGWINETLATELIEEANAIKEEIKCAKKLLTSVGAKGVGVEPEVMRKLMQEQQAMQKELGEVMQEA